MILLESEEIFKSLKYYFKCLVLEENKAPDNYIIEYVGKVDVKVEKKKWYKRDYIVDEIFFEIKFHGQCSVQDNVAFIKVASVHVDGHVNNKSEKKKQSVR